MHTGGPITQGPRAQKKLQIEEREYLYDRGKIFNTVVSGFASDIEYSNGYNNRELATGDNQIQYPDTNYPYASRDMVLFNAYDEVQIVGTATAAVFNKRYLVVEAKCNSTIPQGETLTLYVKLSRTKELEDDGELYGFTITNEYTKYYIDLFAEDITGKRYIALLAGLFQNTSYGIAIKRIYLTNIKEDDIAVAYDGDAVKYLWQGWDGPDGTFNRCGFGSNYMYFEGDGTHQTAVKTARKIDFSSANFIGIQYECTAVGQDSSQNNVNIRFYDNNNRIVAGADNEISATGSGILYLRKRGLLRGTYYPSSSARYPFAAGIEAMAIQTGSGLTLKIKKVWLQ